MSTATRTIRTCSVENCTSKHKAKGLCMSHYMSHYNEARREQQATYRAENREARLNQATTYRASGRQLQALVAQSDRGEPLNYMSAHKVIRHRLGLDDGLPCAICPGQAQHAAYITKAPDEAHGRVSKATGKPITPYSPSASTRHYLPLCASCHGAIDFRKDPDTILKAKAALLRRLMQEDQITWDAAHTYRSAA